MLLHLTLLLHSLMEVCEHPERRKLSTLKGHYHLVPTCADSGRGITQGLLPYVITTFF